MERGHDMVYVCYDNEAYMNTGIQRSSSTPHFADTTTTPQGTVIPGKMQQKKNLTKIMVAHGIPYVAQTTFIGNFKDITEKAHKYYFYQLIFMGKMHCFPGITAIHPSAALSMLSVVHTDTEEIRCSQIESNFFHINVSLLLFLTGLPTVCRRVKGKRFPVLLFPEFCHRSHIVIDPEMTVKLFSEIPVNSGREHLAVLQSRPGKHDQKLAFVVSGVKISAPERIADRNS